MICNNCRAQLYNGARFCHYCGNAAEVNYTARQTPVMLPYMQVQNVYQRNSLDSKARIALIFLILGYFTPVSVVGPIVALVLSCMILSQEPDHRMARIIRYVSFGSIILYVILLILLLIFVSTII